MSYSLQLQFGSTHVNFSAEQPILVSAVKHIYRSFILSKSDAHEADHHPPQLKDVAEEPIWRFKIDGESYEFDEFDWALRTLEDSIADSLLADVDDCLLLHAGAVSNSTTSYIIVGQSGSGKTTTTLEFLRRGYLFLTDEFTAIESSGKSIRPFPRCATRKFDSPTPAGSIMELPEQFETRSHMLPEQRASLNSQPLRESRIIFPRHNQSARPQVRLLDSAELCARLMPSIFNFDGQEAKLWPILANLVTASQACEFTYNSAATDLDLALSVFD